MKNIPSISSGTSTPIFLELLKVWDVESDSAYDNHAPSHDRHLTAIRTLQGEGEVSITHGKRVRLEPDSLIVLERNKIKRHRCASEAWGFWWFEFKVFSPLPFALAEKIETPPTPADAAEFIEIFTKLRNPAHGTRCIASAMFTTMLHRWIANAAPRTTPTPHREIVDTLIERIHADLASDWSTPRLVRESGLAETRLRIAFKTATGAPPARFIRYARLQIAHRMIQEGGYTLAHIAELLNFSSAFHLSNLIKERYGASPATIRQPH